MIPPIAACSGDPAPVEAPPPPPVATAPSANAEPWRFRATLEQHLPDGAVAEPILELSLPRARSVVLVAAVLRARSGDVGLERWTFEQIPGEASLRLVDGGQRIIRLDPGPRHPELGALRRQLATPRVVLTRPLGVPDASPEGVVRAVGRAMTTMHDRAAEPRARVEAAAAVVRGLDDAIVLERDAIAPLRDVLVPAPPPLHVTALSDRRARATLTRDGRTATVELQRKAGGWVVSSFEAPPPPEPADDSPTSPSAP